MKLNIKQAKRIGVHGHRGSRGTHPENTFAGFKEALACGADFFEIDLQLSKDDIPMVFHDPVISPRVCKVSTVKPLREMTAEEIASFDCGSIPQVTFSKQKPVPGEKIPSFSALCEWLQKEAKAIGVNVEIKYEAANEDQLPDRSLFVGRVVETLRGNKLLDRAIVQSFDHEMVGLVRKQAPELMTSCLFEEEEDFLRAAEVWDAGAIGPHFKMLTAAIIESCHRKGIQVLPWTVNDPKDWELLISWGVDGIITDYPRELLASLHG